MEMFADDLTAYIDNSIQIHIWKAGLAEWKIGSGLEMTVNKSILWSINIKQEWVRYSTNERVLRDYLTSTEKDKKEVAQQYIINIEDWSKKKASIWLSSTRKAAVWNSVIG